MVLLVSVPFVFVRVALNLLYSLCIVAIFCCGGICCILVPHSSIGSFSIFFGACSEVCCRTTLSIGSFSLLHVLVSASMQISLRWTNSIKSSDTLFFVTSFCFCYILCSQRSLLRSYFCNKQDDESLRVCKRKCEHIYFCVYTLFHQKLVDNIYRSNKFIRKVQQYEW